MYYYLYWDESASGDGTKLCRTLYSSLEEAEAQRDHEMKCFRCNGTGEEPLDSSKDCITCEGTGENWSRNLVSIEESETVLGGSHRSSLERGRKVWTPSVE